MPAPKGSRASARVFGGARLANHRDLDLPRVLELLLDRARDLVGEQRRSVVVDAARGDHHADLSPRLHRVDLLDPVVPAGDLLEVAQALDVLLEGLAARAGPGARERVGGLHDHRLDRLRLDLVVVGLHRVRNRLRLPIPARELAAHERVWTLDLMRDRLADVVQKRGAARGLGTRAQLLGHQRSQPRDLHRVRQHVLTVAGAEAQLAEQLDELRMDALHARLHHRLLPELHDVGLKLGLRLVVHLLDPRRMDATVLEQLLEREPRDLPADAVEAREHHRSRGIVDDEVNAGEVLERADVAPFAPDDPPLHVVSRELHHRHGRLGCVARSHPLHAHREDVAHPPLGLALGLLLDLANSLGGIVARLVLDLLEQQLLRPRCREAGDALELARELGALVLELRAPTLELIPLALELAAVMRDSRSELLDLGLAPAHLGAATLELLIHLRRRRRLSA